MQNIDKVLVGIDAFKGTEISLDGLSEPNRNAVNRATWLAGQTGATVIYVVVVDAAGPTRVDFESGETGAQVRELLAELEAFASTEGVKATSRLVYGKAAVELTRLTVEESVDILIVGSRNASRASRLLFGSTAMKLLRYCPCPVWVSKPDTDWSDLEILVASSLKDGSEELLDLGVLAAKLVDAKLRVVHACEHDMERRMAHVGVKDRQLQEFREKECQAAEQMLHEQLSHTDYRTISKGVQIDVCSGDSENAILDRIEDHKIDLLIMGTVGRYGVSGMLVGNTAERLLPQIPCSILAVKPPGFQCPLKWN